MTEPEARTKPISEVWEHFHQLLKTNEGGQWKAAFGVETSLQLSMLRAVLLERCMEEGELPCDLIFSFTERGFALMYMHDRKWIADADDFTELAAAAAFMAWELKQRNAESNG